MRASRAALSRALADAGLKTQSALAERIADLEGLDAAPRDLVNRVFRERPVDPPSLERIARALGVKAHTLYLSSSEVPADAGLLPAVADEAPPPRRRRIATRWLAAGGVLAALMVAAVVIWNLPTDTSLGCGVSEFLHPPRAGKGRLGILIARFANDPGNRAQRFFADNFISDSELDPYVSVLTTCHVLSLDRPGNVGEARAAERRRARKLVQNSGARILLWGRASGNRVEVRFVSGRQGRAPVSLEIGGRPVAVEERRLEIPLLLNDPAGSLPDIKKAALELMSLQTPAQSRLRALAMRSYKTSIAWLRASVVASENLRHTINPRLDPQRWAAVNSNLCYNYRLLGEYEEKAADFESARTACENVLQVRPKAEYPQDWAQAHINLASAYVRLHVFAANRAGSIALLRKAEASLLAADGVVKRPLAPQLWAVVRRNLGLVYLHLAELAQPADATPLFNRAIALSKASLETQNPSFQPLDWAVTQQNICLAQHELGERRGKAGMAEVREAIGHCREALRWLSPAQSPLDWAMAQNNLAIAQALLAQLQSDKANLTTAIAAFEKTQTVYSRRDLPVNWAMVETNLGELYCHLARFGNDSAAYDSAVAHTSQALEVFITRKIVRYQNYAETQLAEIKSCRTGDAVSCRCGG